MYYILKKITFLDNLIARCEFQSGEVKDYDFKQLFIKYPIFKRLEEDILLFKNGHIAPGGYAVIFDDELDLSVEDLYFDGVLVDTTEISDIRIVVGNMISKAREELGITQPELAKITKIHQADISNIERGIGNPTIKTLDRIAKGLGLNLKLFLE